MPPSSNPSGAAEFAFVAPRVTPLWLLQLMLLVNLVGVAYSAFGGDQIPDLARFFATGLSLLALVLALLVMPRNFTVGFLTSLLPFIITWRVGAIFNVGLIEAIASVTMAVYLVLFFDAMHNDWRNFRANG